MSENDYLEPQETLDDALGEIAAEADPFPLAEIAETPTTRRTFIKGVIASGAAVSASGFLFRAGGLGTARAATPAAASRMLSLKVNGKVRRVDVLPQDTLALTLRYKLGLTGTKLGCDRGECGACTVLINDVPHYSCTTLTHSVRARDVTTVEGLSGSGGKLHPVQQAFIDELAPQCGFCTPGQAMAAAGLLKANPKPTRDEARLAMSGNLCRCGCYTNYLDGVMKAAGSA